MNAASWFLVMFAGHYIGPISQPACERAAIELRSEGVVCRQATSAYACPVPGRPSVFTSCPVFDFPQVTVKEGK